MSVYRYTYTIFYDMTVHHLFCICICILPYNKSVFSRKNSKQDFFYCNDVFSSSSQSTFTVDSPVATPLKRPVSVIITSFLSASWLPLNTGVKIEHT